MRNSSTEHTESELISRIIGGDRQSYRILYDASVDHLYRFLKQFRNDDNDVRELVQRAFVKAYEGLATFSGRSSFRTWLFRIALNEWKGDRRRQAAVTFEDPGENEHHAGVNEEETLEWNATLRTLFRQLDETKRIVFTLYEVEGYSHAEIAEMLEIGESTSRTILTRTKQQLRKQLQETVRNR